MKKKRGPALKVFLGVWQPLSDPEIRSLANFNEEEWGAANPSDSALMAMELVARRADDKEDTCHD